MDLLHVEMNFYADEKQIKIHSQFTYSQHCIVLIRDGHADIFSDTHRCGYSHYPYVGYSQIYAAHISDLGVLSESAWPSLVLIHHSSLTRV